MAGMVYKEGVGVAGHASRAQTVSETRNSFDTVFRCLERGS